ncbi:MAG: hypothetical protein ACQEQV_10090 [Fibrobacterota bacterium]
MKQTFPADIEWNDNISGAVRISLMKAGKLYTVLADSTESDGAFEWIPDGSVPEGTDYAVKITARDSTDLSGISDSVFTVSAVDMSKDLINFADWYVMCDSGYSGENASDISMMKSEGDTIVRADMSVGLSGASDNIWPWAALFAEAPDNLGGVTAVRITYSCSEDFEIILSDTILSADGTEYRGILPATEDFETRCIFLDSFAQPDWVETPAELDPSKAASLAFGMVDGYGKEGSISIADLHLYDYSGSQGEESILTPDNSAEAGMTFSVDSRNVNLHLPRAGTYTLTVYSLTGRIVEERTMRMTAGTNRIPRKLFSGLGNNLYLLSLEGAGQKTVGRFLMQ